MTEYLDLNSPISSIVSEMNKYIIIIIVPAIWNRNYNQQRVFFLFLLISWVKKRKIFNVSDKVSSVKLQICVQSYWD